MNGTVEEDELTGNVLKAAELLRGEGGVSWPEAHVELALVRFQRTRRQRRALATGAAISALGLVALVVLATGSPSRPLGRALLAVRHVTPAVVAAAPPAPVVVAPAPVAPVSAPAPVATAPAARPGHLLQQRMLPRRQVAAARWVALAGEKRFGEAYGLLSHVPLRELDDPDELMLAADVVRQAGRPAQAVPFLERVVKDHPKELCAQLAGFSLGKVYLDSLGEPALAAKSFAAVRELAPAGGLAQDALAREVEAWSRAGDGARAKQSAAEYVRLYPTGRRLAAVRDLAGI